MPESSLKTGTWLTLHAGLETLPARLVPDYMRSDAEFEAFCLCNDMVQIERGRNGTIHLYPLNSIAASAANAEITAQLRAWSVKRADLLSMMLAFIGRSRM